MYSVRQHCVFELGGRSTLASLTSFSVRALQWVTRSEGQESGLPAAVLYGSQCTSMQPMMVSTDAQQHPWLASLTLGARRTCSETNYHGVSKESVPTKTPRIDFPVPILIAFPLVVRYLALPLPTPKYPGVFLSTIDAASSLRTFVFGPQQSARCMVLQPWNCPMVATSIATPSFSTAQSPNQSNECNP